MSATSLLLIRHAEVETSYHRVFGGSRTDMGLSPLGHSQAVALARYLHRRNPAAVYASPMKRVRLTLAPLTGDARLKPVIKHDLREVDFGDWTGLTWEEVREKFGISAFDWLEELHHARMPGAESGAQLIARTRACAGEILADHPGQTVVLASHGGVIRALLAAWLDLPLPKTVRFDVDYASVTQVDFTPPDRVELRMLNLAPWRELE